MNIVPTKLNRHLANSVLNRMESDLFLIKGRTWFCRLVGVGLLALGLGVAVGIGTYGYSHVTRNSGNFEVLAEAITKGLSKIALKSVAEGTVKIEPSEIRLASGQTISFDKNSRVLLDPSATIRADGEFRVQPPLLPSSQLPTSGQPASRAPTIVNFTVFKQVPYDGGFVMTGWVFLTSAQRTPSEQYCYYTINSDSSGLDVVVDLGKDGRLERPATPMTFNVEAAFARCVWFRT